MPETYAPLKMNADDIISQIQNLPAEQEGREWALELGIAEGKQVRYSETVSPLWEILETITHLHRSREKRFRYAGILRLPRGPSFSQTFEGQQVFAFGKLNQILRALEIERQNQQAKAGLNVQAEQPKSKFSSPARSTHFSRQPIQDFNKHAF
jgi:hypothetical protein